MPKKILLLGRKDSKHPKAGGAELVIHRYAQGLINAGYQATQIAPLFSGAQKEEYIDGIHIKRMFSIHTIYFCFWLRYFFRNKETYDCVIDHAGGIPFLTPLYIWKTPIVFFTHHLGTTERTDYFHPFRFVGSIFRRIYTNLVIKLYREKPTITVSEGTAHDLRTLGFTHVTVLPNATDYPIISQVVSSKELILTTVGRVVPNKQFAHAISILRALHDAGLQYHLSIVGAYQDEREYASLQETIKEANLEAYIHFTGKISADELIKLRDKTRYGLITSDKEGFGLTTLEANARGVPMLGYAIPGVDEVIHHGKNGYLAPKNDRSALASIIINESEEDYARLINSTKTWIDTYPTREMNTTKFISLLEEHIHRFHHKI